jgi:uncharacterized protein
MAEQDNVRRVNEIYGAFARGDVRAVLDQLADDVDWYDPGPAPFPTLGATAAERMSGVHLAARRDAQLRGRGPNHLLVALGPP